MNRVRRIITLCLVIVILCSVTAVSFAAEGYYGTEEQPLPYPVTSRFMDSEENYWSWYINEYETYSKYEGSLEYLSRLWFYNFKFGDTEVWHEAYLRKFSFILDNSVDLYIPASETEDGNTPMYRLDSASWNDNKLTVQCSADITVRYDQYEDNQGIEYISPRNADVYAVIAMRNADSNSLAYLGDVEDFSLVPEYRYGIMTL